MMKLLLAFLILLGGCSYDPPIKGKEIIIHNQTSDYIFVMDSLARNDIEPYDSFKVNGRQFIAAKGNYIPKYNNWEYFFSESKRESMKKNQVDSLCFYIITQKSLDSIQWEKNGNVSYKRVSIKTEDVIKNSMTYLFYYGDSSKVTHSFDVEH